MHLETPGGREFAKIQDTAILNPSVPFCAAAWQKGELKGGVSVGGPPAALGPFLGRLRAILEPSWGVSERWKPEKAKMLKNIYIKKPAGNL